MLRSITVCIQSPSRGGVRDAGGSVNGLRSMGSESGDNEDGNVEERTKGGIPDLRAIFAVLMDGMRGESPQKET